ncbi:MAG TPA: response regulator [Gaiellaceae bacterium]|jgi:DNA-binding NarL/FixJ family response regulator/class 3 adenylate cyclase
MARRLPTGTVTLLCTDIEGSTSIVGRLGERYVEVLEQHRDIVRDAVAGAGGMEIDCRGDEMLLVFTGAEAAVRGAVEAQRALAAHAWPEGNEVRVRMGVHTGEPSVEGSTYVGLDVHRVARISEAGHGGQVLLSARTHELAGADAIDLGAQPFKGLPEPERIYQVVADGLPREFPPLRLEGAPAGIDDDASNDDAMRVVVAEDSVLLREGIARLLEDAGIEVVGQAGNADELMLKVRSYKPNVAIVDIRMPPTQTDEGLRAAKEIRERHPETCVLVLSQYLEPAYALELLSESAEGVGYLLKDRVADVPEFVAAVQRVGEGGSALDPSVVSQLVGRHRRDDPVSQLTPREREVLELMAEGLSNSAIAERLVVTERAVEKHVTSIFGKLKLGADSETHRRVLAVLAFLRA